MIRETIQSELDSQKITQRELARRAKMTEPQLSDFLKGKSSLKMETIEAILQALNIKLIKIL
jgi:transcriptional regulator with XRE-family HTH domain